jgi:hypothetical protein
MLGLCMNALSYDDSQDGSGANPNKGKTKKKRRPKSENSTPMKTHNTTTVQYFILAKRPIKGLRRAMLQLQQKEGGGGEGAFPTTTRRSSKKQK